MKPPSPIFLAIWGNILIKMIEKEKKMGKTIVDTSREFFNEMVKPILEREFPTETVSVNSAAATILSVSLS